MDSRGWLARVFGTEGTAARPRKRKESRALKAVPRVEKRLCGNCASSVGVAANRCPHCGYRLAQPNASRADGRPGPDEPDGAVSERALDENVTRVAVSLPLVTGETVLPRASGA